MWDQAERARGEPGEAGGPYAKGHRVRCRGLETMANLRVLRERVIRLEIHLNGASLRARKRCGRPNPGQSSGDERADRTDVLYLEEQQPR